MLKKRKNIENAKGEENFPEEWIAHYSRTSLDNIFLNSNILNNKSYILNNYEKLIQEHRINSRKRIFARILSKLLSCHYNTLYNK